MMDVTALSSLLTVLLVVTELQILTNGVKIGRASCRERVFGWV